MRQLGRCWLWPGRLLSSQHPLYSWRYFTRTCFSEVLTCTSPQVLCLVRGLSNSGPSCLRANYWPQCPGLSALGTWHYFYYQVAKGLKLLCDHVSAGEKSLKLPSSGAKSVPPPPLLWVEAIVHLKSRNWPRLLCWHALGGIRLEGVKIYNCKRCTSSLIFDVPASWIYQCPGCQNLAIKL